MAMLAIIARLNALEAEVKVLREVQPLESFTASLKQATPEQVKAWMDLCSEVAASHMEVASHTEVNEKKVKKVTNAEGPKAWNAFIRAVRHEMAAEKGVVIEGEGEAAEKAFGKEADKVGVTFGIARAEASRRKALMEGKEPKVLEASPAKASPKPKAKATHAEVQAKVAAAAAAKAPVESELEIQLAADKLGYVLIEHEGENFFYDPTDDMVWNYPAADEQIGTYIDGEFVRSE
jgi:hypothetical protein